MTEKKRCPIIKIEKGAGYKAKRCLVEEFPLKLVANGQPLAILISSPHQLN